MGLTCNNSAVLSLAMKRGRPKKELTLREHLRRIPQINTDATRAARSQNMKLARQVRARMLAGMPKAQALEQARKDVAD